MFAAELFYAATARRTAAVMAIPALVTATNQLGPEAPDKTEQQGEEYERMHGPAQGRFAIDPPLQKSITAQGPQRFSLLA